MSNAVQDLEMLGRIERMAALRHVFWPAWDGMLCMLILIISLYNFRRVQHSESAHTIG